MHYHNILLVPAYTSHKGPSISKCTKFTGLHLIDIHYLLSVFHITSILLTWPWRQGMYTRQPRNSAPGQSPLRLFDFGTFSLYGNLLYEYSRHKVTKVAAQCTSRGIVALP